VITEHVPFTDFNKALHHHSTDEIKVVVDWVSNLSGETIDA
jgi:hypothetical protein